MEAGEGGCCSFISLTLFSPTLHFLWAGSLWGTPSGVFVDCCGYNPGSRRGSLTGQATSPSSACRKTGLWFPSSTSPSLAVVRQSPLGGGPPAKVHRMWAAFLHGCNSSQVQNFPGSFCCCKRIPPQLGGSRAGYLNPPTLPLHPSADFPKVRIRYDPTPMAEGQSVNLTCHITGEPQPVADWDVPQVGAERPLRTKASGGWCRPGSDLENAPVG